MNTKSFTALDRMYGSNIDTRRYNLSDMISESYRLLYDTTEGTHIQKLAESHLEDVRSNPTEIDRLSRNLSILKELKRMTESEEISDKDLEDRPFRRRRPIKETACEEQVDESEDTDLEDEELTEEELEELSKHLNDIRKNKAPTKESCDEAVDPEVDDPKAPIDTPVGQSEHPHEDNRISKDELIFIRDRIDTLIKSMEDEDLDTLRVPCGTEGVNSVPSLVTASGCIDLDNAYKYLPGNNDERVEYRESKKPTENRKLGESSDPDYELQNMISEVIGNAIYNIFERNGLDPDNDKLLQDFYYRVDIDNLVYNIAKFIESHNNRSTRESKKPVVESTSYKGLENFSKNSSSKAFYKTFKKMHESLKEGKALTRQESMNLYKAANSAMTQLSVELEHNPEFLETFKECTAILSADVTSLLESMKRGKAPSKKTMKSLAKFSEALLCESEKLGKSRYCIMKGNTVIDSYEDKKDADEWVNQLYKDGDFKRGDLKVVDSRTSDIRESDEDFEDVEIPAEETPEDDFIGDDEGDVASEAEEEFDQEYADARVELHKELEAEHAEDEDTAVQDKIEQDKEEVLNLDGITDEQVAELTGEEPTESEESPNEEMPIEEPPVEDDDDEITDDELAELKKHLTEMRKAKRNC